MKSFRLFVVSSGATNFYERHGNNFIYLDSMSSNQFDTLTYAPVIWAEVVPCTNVFTGDSNWGYDIYETTCRIYGSTYPELVIGTHYYFETQADVTDNCFILVSNWCMLDCTWIDEGSGVWESTLSANCPCDLFFDFYGEPVSALKSETWGSIKTLF
jgi:hypothetical protein